MLVLLAGAVPRLLALDSVPPGLTHDEANNVYDGAGILRGLHRLFFPVAQGKEPLYLYSVAGMMAWLGTTPFAMRLTTAFWGLLLLAVTFTTVRRLFALPEAFLTTAGLALSFWGFSTSRMGLRAVTSPLFFTLSIRFLYQATACRAGIGSRRGGILRWALLSGLLLGLTQYTYLAARVAPAVFVLYGLVLLLRRPVDWPAVGRVLLALCVAGAVAAPLAVYLYLHPELSVRVGMLDQPLRALLAGDPRPLWEKVGPALGMFFLSGDTFLPYNIPGRPLFGPLTAILFVAGLLLVLWRVRRPVYALVLIWLLVGVFPAFVTGIEAVNLRAIVAQPVIYLLPALPVTALARRVASPRRATVVWALAVLLLAGTAVGDARAYFGTWANDPDVRAHYHMDLVAIAAYLDAHTDGGPAAISGLFPGQFHDPRVVAAEMDRADDSARWFDARGGLVLPAEPGRLFLSALTPVDPALEPLLIAHATPLERIELRPDDTAPWVDVMRWDGPGAVAGLLPTMGGQPVWWSPADSFPTSGTTELLQPLALPVPVGEGLVLAGYDLPTPRVAPGGTVELVALWTVVGFQPGDVVLFTHMLDPAGQVVGQADRLDVPSWDWRPGDSFLQVHRFSVPADLPPGAYPLEVGAYLRQDPSACLPVEGAPGVVHHRILLAPVEVSGP